MPTAQEISIATVSAIGIAFLTIQLLTYLFDHKVTTIASLPYRTKILIIAFSTALYATLFGLSLTNSSEAVYVNLGLSVASIMVANAMIFLFASLASDSLPTHIGAPGILEQTMPMRRRY
jgi:uncharacterized membrane protein